MSPASRARSSRVRRAAAILAALLAAYLFAAYLAAPEFWSFRDRGRAPAAMLTTTPQGIPGDPVNVGLVGSREEVFRAFAAAGWKPADAITFDTSVKIGLSVVLDRPDPEAPVSTLLFEGRRQDVAFEKPVGTSADQRHHVRFWETADATTDGRPLWLGAASFDKGVGFSHDTGQITHHIGPDLDAERDLVIGDLDAAGRLALTYRIDGVEATRSGRNGGGDPYFTDGKAEVGVLRTAE
jgi:hypothetical protein